MERVRRFIVTHLWWVVLVVALAMLISHSFGVRGIVVDNISLILLALVLISPFVAAIKKVKIGEFEAEIEPAEVKRVAQQAEKSLPHPEPTPSLAPEISETAAAIRSLALTTVVPYVDNPEQRVYVLNQDELDAFLEGYSEFAEFMVRLEKVE